MNGQTSINKDKLPRAHKLLDNRNVRALTGGITVGQSFILDHGCGRYIEHVSKHANELGYGYCGWDEHWSSVENVWSYDYLKWNIDRVYKGMRAVHISSNVMNVITDDWELEQYCTRVWNAMERGERLILTVYEAPKPSKSQRAEPLALYVEKLESYYGLKTLRQTKGYAILKKD